MSLAVEINKMRKPFDAGAILKRLEAEPSKPGEFEIKGDGSWHHRGGKIERPAMVALFASILYRNDHGHHFLVTPFEQHEVRVEDAALLVVDFDQTGADIEATADTGERCWMDADHSVSMAEIEGEHRPYMRWRRGLRARIRQSAFYRLVEFGDIEGDRFVLRSRGASFDLGAIA